MNKYLRDIRLVQKILTHLTLYNAYQYIDGRSSHKVEKRIIWN